MALQIYKSGAIYTSSLREVLKKAVSETITTIDNPDLLEGPNFYVAHPDGCKQPPFDTNYPQMLHFLTISYRTEFING